MDVPALNMLVKELIAKHTGGKEFFNALDEVVTDGLFFDKLYQLAMIDDAYRTIEEDEEQYHTIVSGKFGIALSNWLRQYHFDNDAEWSETSGVLLVNGGLRDGDPITDLSPYWEQVQNEKYVFVDDSFFSGRTRNIIAKELERLHGQLMHTYVVYDGSDIPDPRVTSLYRYYDEIEEE